MVYQFTGWLDVWSIGADWVGWDIGVRPCDGRKQRHGT